MSTDTDVRVRLNLDGETSVTAGVSRVGQAFALSAEDALQLEKATAATAVAQSRLQQATAASTAAQQALSAAQRDSAISAEKLTQLQQKAAQAQAAQSLAMVKLTEQTNGLRKLEEAHVGLAKSQALTGQQTAQLSAQLQDFFVQVQSGGSPMTALIQQGSQLSAVFGGIRPALAAIATVFTPLVVVGSAVAATVGGIALAFAAGARESAQLRQDLALTGNAAGLVSGQFDTLARSISGRTLASVGTAREALSALVTDGRLSARAIEATAGAVSALARATGESAADIAKRFGGIADDVTGGARRLNDQFNFLTAAQFAYIKSLEEAGDKQGAMVETMRALEGRIGTSAQALGTLESAWIAVRNAISAAWDASKNIGRDLSTSDQIKALENRISATQAGNFDRAELPGLRQQLEGLRELLRIETRGAEAAQQRAASAREGIALELQYGEAVKSNAQKLDDQIAKYKARAAIAGVDPATQERVIAALRQQSAAFQQALADDAAKIQGALSVTLAKLRGELASVESLARRGLVSPIEAIEQRGALAVKQLEAERTELVRLLDVAKKRTENEAERDRLSAAIAAKGIDIDNARKNSALQVADAMDKLRKSADAAYRAERQLGEDEIAQFLVRQSEALKTASAAVQDYAQEVNDANSFIAIEAAMIGKTEIERRRAIEDLRIEIALRKQKDAIMAAGLNRVDRDKLIADAEAAARQARAGADIKAAAEATDKASKDALEVWRRTYDLTGDALYDAITGNWTSAKKLIESQVIKPIVQAALSPITGSITSALTGQAIPGFGSVGGSGALGNALGIAGLVQGLGSFGATGLMATLTGTSLGTSLGAAGSLIAGGNVAGGLGMGAGALGPYAAAALVAASVVKALDSSGTPHVGGYVKVGPDGKIVDITGAEGGRQQADTQDAVGKLAVSFSGLLNTTAKSFGKEAGFAVRAVFESDNNDPSWGILGLLRNGVQAPQSFAATGTLASDAGKGFEQFTAQSVKAVRDALVAMDLPGWASDALRALGDSPGLEDLTTTVQGIQQTQAAIGGLRDALRPLGGAFSTLAGLSDDATLAITKAAGGFDVLTAGLGAYFTNFFSTAEQTTLRLGAMSSELSAVGLALPTTREGFRALVESQDLTTAAGQQAYATLIRVAGAFAELVPAADSATTATEEVVAAVVRMPKELQAAIRSNIGRFQTPQQQTDFAFQSVANDLQSAGVLTGVQDLVSVLRGADKQAIYDFAAAFVALADVSDASKIAVVNAAGALGELKDSAAKLAQDAADAAAAAADQAQKAAAAAAEAAAQRVRDVMAGIGDTGTELRARLLEGRGDAAGALALRRAAELAKLTENASAEDAARIRSAFEVNAALEDQIAAEALAAEASRQAAEAARQHAEAMQSLGRTLRDEANRIRGLNGNDQPSTLARAQADFAITSAQARAGDTQAGQRLGGIASQIIELTQGMASTALDVRRMQGRLAGSLDQTAAVVTGQTRGRIAPVDLSLFAAPAGQDDASRELAALRTDNRAQAAALASLNARVLEIFERWDRTGMPEVRAV